MSDTLKRAIRNLARAPGGFDGHLLRATVLSVDKNAATCNVVTVTDGIELDNVKLKAVVNSGDLTQMGIIVYPAVNSFVMVGIAGADNIDLCVLGVTEIESIALDTATALNLLVTADGKVNLNAVQMMFNNGQNGGIPLVNPLANAIMKLQQQVNQLISTFNLHIHPATSGTTSPTVTPGPPPTDPLLQPRDIANTKILQ